MDWLYRGSPVKHPPVASISFVYRIYNTQTGKTYIGKKGLLKSKLKKSGNRKSRIFVKSDWEEYYGSNKELLADVAALGKEHFVREILRWCDTKGDASYYEIKYQLQYEVLEHPEKFYNVFIGCRIHRNHLSMHKKPRS